MSRWKFILQSRIRTRLKDTRPGIKEGTRLIHYEGNSKFKIEFEVFGKNQCNTSPQRVSDSVLRKY